MVRGRLYHLAIQFRGATFRSTRGTTMASNSLENRRSRLLYNL